MVKPTKDFGRLTLYGTYSEQLPNQILIFHDDATMLIFHATSYGIIQVYQPNTDDPEVINDLDRIFDIDDLSLFIDSLCHYCDKNVRCLYD